VPSVRCGPDQACRFNVEPSGDRPYSNLFLSALPVKMFWTDVWAVETKRYHKVVTEMGQAPTPTVRPWTDDNVTPCEWWPPLSCEGLSDTRQTLNFFAGTSQCGGRFSQQPAAAVLKLSLMKYQQLLRFTHIVDNLTRAPLGSDDHDKLFHVRPLIARLQSTFRRWCVPGKNNAMDEAGLPSRPVGCAKETRRSHTSISSKY